MSKDLMKQHSDEMLKVAAGYSYSPNLAEKLYFRIKELETELEKQIGYKNDYRVVNEQLWEERRKTREEAFIEAADLCDTTNYYDFREKGVISSLREEILQLIEGVD